MIPLSRLLVVLSSVASLPGLGCYVEARPVPVTEEAYVQAPEPPPPQVEVVPVSPGPEFVWVGGYHRWDGRAYVWTRGHYDRRPHEHARWVVGHWERHGRAHVWVDGRWH